MDYGRLQPLCNSDKTSLLQQIGLNINNELKDSPLGEILMTSSLKRGTPKRGGGGQCACYRDLKHLFDF